MKKIVKILSLLLVMATLFSLASCAKLEEFFGGEDTDEDTDGTGNTGALIGEIDPRVPGVYNFLMVSEGEKAGSALAFTVFQMSLSETSLSIFQIPKNLFVSDANAKSLEEIYKKEYDRISALGLTLGECELGGAKAVSACLEANLSLPIDYHMVLSKDAFVNYIDLIDGVEMNLPFDFTTDEGKTYSAGVRTLEGEAAFNFASYGFFADQKSQLNAMREVFAGIHKKLTAELSSENISIHMVQAKPLLSTDLPTKDGYDIFFLRKLIAVTPAAWSVTELCTYPASVASGNYEVIRYSTALEQLNTFLSIYKDPVKASTDAIGESDKVFDPEGKFNDPSQMIINTIYKSSTALPTVYTAEEVYTGKLEISQK